ncbi:MAG: hypothetical protein AAF493_21900 [Pseudomonadota bacterium]
MRSWITSANAADHPFPLNNLPYGVFTSPGDGPRCGVAIGDHVLDVALLEREGVINLERPLLQTAQWNDVMAAGVSTWSSLRRQLTALLSESSPHRGSTRIGYGIGCGAKRAWQFARAIVGWQRALRCRWRHPEILKRWGYRGIKRGVGWRRFFGWLRTVPRDRLAERLSPAMREARIAGVRVIRRFRSRD